MALCCYNLLCAERVDSAIFDSTREALLEIKTGFWELQGSLEALIGRHLTKVVLQQAGSQNGVFFARDIAPNPPLDQQSCALYDCIAAYGLAGFGQFTVESVEWPIGRVIIRADDTFECCAYQHHRKQTTEPVCAYSAGVLAGIANELTGRRDIVCIERACRANGAAACCFELRATLTTDNPQSSPSPTNSDWDGAGSLNLLKTLFERTPIGIVVLDRELRLNRYNPIWKQSLTRHAIASADEITLGAHWFGLFRDTQPLFDALFERAFAGETGDYKALRVVLHDRVSYWDVIVAPVHTCNDVMGVIIMMTDVTERERLQAELRESQQTLSMLLSNLPRMTYHCRNDQNWTIDFVSEGCTALTGYTPADLINRCDHTFVSLIHPADRDMVWENVRIALREDRSFQHCYRIITADGAEKWVWEQGQGVYSADGVLVALEGCITDITERMLVSQNLEQRVSERTRELENRRQVAESLHAMLAILNSNHSLDEILDHIVAQACQLLNAAAGAIFHFDTTHGVLTIQAARGLPLEYVATISIPVGQGAVGRAVLDLKPVVVTDIAPFLQKTLKYDLQQQSNLDWLSSHFQGLVAVPLNIRHSAYGTIVLYFPEPRDLSAEEIRLIVAFTDQAALAIETARLQSQAEQAAVAAERNRLARDLHDSVTQTLFSANLIAEVLPDLWKHNPDEGHRRLDELRMLTRGALAEMRTLLLELRPSALTEAGMNELLRQLTEATMGRARIPITLTVTGQLDLPPRVRIALYRIAQEALNNVAKHANATQATISLHCRPAYVELRIRDDGCGFRRDSISTEHLGLDIMNERAEDIGAELTIESQPGYGSQVIVFWPNPKERTTLC